MNLTPTTIEQAGGTAAAASPTTVHAIVRSRGRRDLRRDVDADHAARRRAAEHGTNLFRRSRLAMKVGLLQRRDASRRKPALEAAPSVARSACVRHSERRTLVRRGRPRSGVASRVGRVIVLLGAAEPSSFLSRSGQVAGGLPHLGVAAGRRSQDRWRPRCAARAGIGTRREPPFASRPFDQRRAARSARSAARARRGRHSSARVDSAFTYGSAIARTRALRYCGCRQLGLPAARCCSWIAARSRAARWRRISSGMTNRPMTARSVSTLTRLLITDSGIDARSAPMIGVTRRSRSGSASGGEVPDGRERRVEADACGTLAPTGLVVVAALRRSTRPCAPSGFCATKRVWKTIRIGASECRSGVSATMLAEATVHAAAGPDGAPSRLTISSSALRNFGRKRIAARSPPSARTPGRDRQSRPSPRNRLGPSGVVRAPRAASLDRL